MTPVAGVYEYGDGPEPGGHPPVAAVVFIGIIALFVAIIAIVIGTLGGTAGTVPGAKERAEALAKLPPYWTVKRGDTYSSIAGETGLTIEELETFNPRVDPASIVPGQKLLLRAKPPPAKPKPKGPKWHTVKRGETFASIAARFGHSYPRLQQLNPKLKAASLQPGDRMRLRR